MWAHSFHGFTAIHTYKVYILAFHFFPFIFSGLLPYPSSWRETFRRSALSPTITRSTVSTAPLGHALRHRHDGAHCIGTVRAYYLSGTRVESIQLPARYSCRGDRSGALRLEPPPWKLHMHLILDSSWPRARGTLRGNTMEINTYWRKLI
jgi:hypothetical protein